MPKIIVFFVFSFLLMTFSTMGQYHSSGADPWSVRWQVLRSSHAKIIFSADMVDEAQRLALILDTLNRAGGFSLNHRPRPINVVLHSKTAYSNGFVTWAPKRTEFYTTASQTEDAQDWLTHLAIHEYRHVVQMDRLNNGFTHVLGYVFGQQAVGAVGGLFYPFWFLEGDAVLTETLLSRTGRGRMAEFEQELRAQLVDGSPFSMSKAFLGSYRHYVPNHYNMGYALVAGARNRYGSTLWSDAAKNTGRNSWTLTPFNSTIKQVAGMGKRRLYESVFAEWQQKWRLQDSLLKVTDYKCVVSSGNNYLNFQYPSMLDDGHVMAWMNGPGVVGQFVSVDAQSGEWRSIHAPGIRQDEPFSVATDKMVWTELEPHWRWENQKFNNIYLMDLRTRLLKRLTSHGRYFSPSLSPDGRSIATIYVSESNHNFIHILSDEGALIQQIATPNNEFPFTPVWTADGRSVVMILHGQAGKCIVSLSLEDQAWQSLTNYSFNQIRLPKVVGDEVFYTSSETGIENIFKIPLSGGTPQQVTSARFGVVGAVSLNADSIIYSSYSPHGYSLVKSQANQVVNDSILSATPSLALLENLKREELPIIDFNSLPKKQFEVKNYSKWNLIGVHSWAPAAIDVDNLDVGSGVSVLSQNALGTMMMTASYRADKQSQLEKFGLKINYRALYPVFTAQISHGDEDRNSTYFSRSGADTLYVQVDGVVKQTRVLGGVALPVNLGRGRYSRLLQPSLSVEYLDNTGADGVVMPVTLQNNKWVAKGASKAMTVGRIGYADIQYGLYFHNIRRGTSRDVGSRWGQSIQLKYRHTPHSRNDVGAMWGAAMRFYLPGLLKHHNMRMDVGYQQKQPGDFYGTGNNGVQYRYLYSDFLTMPRGVNKQMNDQLFVAKANYAFPMVNPDMAVGSILYLKRITANLFYDFAIGHMTQQLIAGGFQHRSFTSQSTGVELMGETHFFQFLVPVELGYRFVSMPSHNSTAHELMLNINIAKFTGFSDKQNRFY